MKIVKKIVLCRRKVFVERFDSHYHLQPLFNTRGMAWKEAFLHNQSVRYRLAYSCLAVVRDITWIYNDP
jgi:hypothetical protein